MRQMERQSSNSCYTHFSYPDSSRTVDGENEIAIKSECCNIRILVRQMTRTPFHDLLHKEMIMRAKVRYCAQHFEDETMFAVCCYNRLDFSTVRTNLKRWLRNSCLNIVSADSYVVNVKSYLGNKRGGHQNVLEVRR